MTTNTSRWMLAAAAAATLMTSPASAQTTGEKLLITAFAVNMSNIGTGANAQVQIYVDKWSTEAERELLITTMVQKGPEALLKALQQQPIKGRFQIPTLTGRDPHNLRLGLQLRYAWQAPLPEGGRRIVLAADRYPFSLFEIRVNKDGEGEGKLAYATKIRFDKDKKVMELENYASEPVRLNNVKVKTRT